MLSKMYYNLLCSNKNRQTVHFNINDLEAFTDLPTRQQKLLVAMIARVKTNHKYASIVTEMNYADFGYEKRQHFHRDKQALEAAGFILTDGKQYVICLHKVMCVSKRYYDNLMVYFGLKQGIHMGAKFDPGLPPVPK